MPLTKFTVIHTANDPGGTIIRCFDRQKMVLAYIRREALDNYFRWPKPLRDEVRPSLEECHLVVDRNLAEFARMIQEKYRRRACCELKKLGGSSRKVIEITRKDVQRSGADLSDTVIDIARAVRRERHR